MARLFGVSELDGGADGVALLEAGVTRLETGIGRPLQPVPSPPMELLGQPSSASWTKAISSAVSGWRWTIDWPLSSSLRKKAGAASRHMSQSMQVAST